MIREHAHRLQLGVVEQVRLVEDDDWGAAPLGVLGRERCGGLRDERGRVEARRLPERGHDVVEHAADPDGRVRQVGHHVSGAVQAGGRGAHCYRLSRADFAGDHAEGVLFDAPADPGDGFGVTVVAVQH